MHVLVISDNPLLKEVIVEAVHNTDGKTIQLVNPDLAMDWLQTQTADVFIIDETIHPQNLNTLLGAIRMLLKSRVILLNPQGNDILLLDTYRATIKEVNDLMIAIGNEPSGPMKKIIDGGFYELAENARARSGTFGFLATLVNQRPDVNFVRRMRSIDVETSFGINSGGATSGNIELGLRVMSDYLDETADLTEEEVGRLLVVDWTRLFRGIRPGYGPPPPYECVYNGRSGDEISTIQAISNWFHRFDITIAGENPNRPDYIGLELDLLSYLAEHEAESWERKSYKEALFFQKSAHDFYSEHPGRWATKFWDAALEHASTNFYRGFIQICQGVMGVMDGT